MSTFDPRFAPDVAGDDDTDIRRARLRLQEAERDYQAVQLQRQLAASLMSGDGVCAYCRKLYADHSCEAEIIAHADAYEQAQQLAKQLADRTKEPRPVVLTDADRVREAMDLVLGDLLSATGQYLSGKVAAERAKSIVRTLQARGFLL